MKLFGRERGQAAIEMGIVMLGLVMVTAGLIDVGRGIFAYTQVSAAARYAARWGSVVGGTCLSTANTPNNDWCYPQNPPAGSCPSQSVSFWCEKGNEPLQGAGVSCPSYTSTPSDWYTVGQYLSSSAPTIVGSLAQHLDTNSSSGSTVLVGSFAPGMDLNQLKVCIQLPNSSPPAPGDAVTVLAYYPFTPAGSLITSKTIGLSAQAQWQVG